MSQRVIDQVEAMSDEELFREWGKIKGHAEGGEKLKWLVRLAVKYHKLIEEAEDAGKKLFPVVYKRYELAKKLDSWAIRLEGEFLTPKYDDKKGDSTMAKTNGSKGSTKEARVTAGSVLIKLLGAAKVQSDEAIIKLVKDETGSSKFDGKQLAWYKWKYRQGKLKGMDGKQHVINQGSPKKAEKVEKTKKRIVVKSKKKVAETVAA